MAEFLTLHEIVETAHRNLSQGVWDYLTGGADTETTLLRNRQGLESIAFRPRVLRNVRDIDLSASLLGDKMRLPVALAPMGSLDSLESGGSVSVAKAAAEFGVTSFLSSVTQPGLEDVADATDHPKIFQLYVRGDHSFIEDFARRAIDKGYRAFCLTVDVAYYSRRDRDLIKRYKPLARSMEGWEYQAELSWDTVKWFKDNFDIPLIIKGIATAEDAAICIEHEVDCIYVSNHGGRQLDHGRASIDVLPEIAKEVGGKAEIIIDGGFMRGTDIIKAIALGANTVAIGKLQGFGLAADGVTGIVRVLELLEIEMRVAMGLLGETRLDGLSPAHLHPAAPVYQPHPLSGFPLLNIKGARY